MYSHDLWVTLQAWQHVCFSMKIKPDIKWDLSHQDRVQVWQIGDICTARLDNCSGQFFYPLQKINEVLWAILYGNSFFFSLYF